MKSSRLKDRAEVTVKRHVHRVNSVPVAIGNEVLLSPTHNPAVK